MMSWTSFARMFKSRFLFWTWANRSIVLVIESLSLETYGIIKYSTFWDLLCIQCVPILQIVGIRSKSGWLIDQISESFWTSRIFPVRINSSRHKSIDSRSSERSNEISESELFWISGNIFVLIQHWEWELSGLFESSWSSTEFVDSIGDNFSTCNDCVPVLTSTNALIEIPTSLLDWERLKKRISHSESSEISTEWTEIFSNRILFQCSPKTDRSADVSIIREFWDHIIDVWVIRNVKTHVPLEVSTCVGVEVIAWISGQIHGGPSIKKLKFSLEYIILFFYSDWNHRKCSLHLKMHHVCLRKLTWTTGQLVDMTDILNSRMESVSVVQHWQLSLKIIWFSRSFYSGLFY